jgi:two-component system, OmpR family, sensor kinase
MPTIRAKLTTAYAGLLLGTMLAFGGVVYVARRATSYNELAQEAALHGDFTLNLLRRINPIVVVPDSLVGPLMSPRLSAILDGLPGYTVIIDSNGRAIYISPSIQRMSQGDKDAVMDAALRFPQSSAVKLDLVANEDVLLIQRQTGDAGEVRSVVTGMSTAAADSGRRELIGTMLVVAPLILGVSIAGAHLIGGRAFEPVKLIINEVEAITDGRSLHRRLAAETTGDELSRLAATLNAMIGRLETSFGALRRFTADASHELKTPLAVLRADVERAMHAPTGSNEQAIALEEALHETTRMADRIVLRRRARA